MRKYPPERFPEEFKALHEARDVLSDPQKREGYDKGRALPEKAAQMAVPARAAFERGRYEDAAALYAGVIAEYPDIPHFRERYARALEESGKTGKAVTVWEELCRTLPENLDYSLALADGYQERGWRKKAAAQFERCLAMDGGSARAWAGLVSCHRDGREFEEAGRYAVEAATATT